MKTVDDFPDWMLDTLKALHEGAPIVQIQGGDLKRATHVRSVFNKFKLAYIQTFRGSDLAQTAKKITVGLTNLSGPGLKGEYILEFLLDEAKELTNALRKAKRGAPPKLTEVKDAIVDEDLTRALEKQTLKDQHFDDSEEEMMKLMGIKKEDLLGPKEGENK